MPLIARFVRWLRTQRVWVDVQKGNDNPRRWRGTWFRPYQTLQAALDNGPRHLDHVFKIIVRPGRYSFNSMPTTTFADGGKLIIQGSDLNNKPTIC